MDPARDFGKDEDEVTPDLTGFDSKGAVWLGCCSLLVAEAPRWTCLVSKSICVLLLFPFYVECFMLLFPLSVP